MSRHLLLEGLYHTAINEEELRRADMANIGLTEEAFFDLCIGVAHLVKEYYKDPANVEAFEKWKAQKAAEAAKREK